MKKILLAIVLILNVSEYLRAQTAISAAGTPPDASAMLDVTATDKGFLAPRVTLSSTTDAATIAGAEANGLLVFNTNASMTGGSVGFYYWNSATSDWQRLVNGNGSFTTGSGTPNYLARWITSSNLGIGVAYDNGTNVGISSTSPGAKLDVSGGDVRVATDNNALLLGGPTASTQYSLHNYTSNSLWLQNQGNTTSKLVVATAFDWDRQVALQYTPGTTGAAAGDLIIGQIDKNDVNWTHGITRFYTNGNERMRIISNGNVGMGTASPGRLLHLHSASGQDGLLINAATYPEIMLQNSGTIRGYLSIAGSAGGYGTGTLAQSLILRSESPFAHLITGGGNITLTANGANIGIGTTGPVAKLHVAGGGQIIGTNGTTSTTRTLTILEDGDAQTNFGSYPGAWTSALQIQDNTTNRFVWISPLDNGSGANARFLTSGSGLDFHTGTNVNTSPPMTLTSAGNVGIQTTSPNGRLDVVGDIYGVNEYSFTGFSEGINNWDYSGLQINPTANSASDDSWYIQSNSNDWSRGTLSKRRFRRTPGLTLEYEAYMDAPLGGNVHYMIGFVDGATTNYSYCQTPSNLMYHDNVGLNVYENCGGQGTSYSFDTRSAWWRFKVVLKGAGADYYVFRNNVWNLVLSTANNSNKYVRVLISAYTNRMFIRGMKVYQADFNGISENNNNGDNLGNHTATTTLNMSGNDISGVNDIFATQNFGRGLVGIYSDTRYQNVFAMGTSWRLPADGTTPGNLYGLAWTHSNIGGQSKGGLSHQLLVMENGVTKVALGSGIWTNYTSYMPFIYDTDNTGYYFDANSTSNTWAFYRYYGFNGPEYDGNDGSFYVDPNGNTRLNRFTAANCQICIYWCDNNCGSPSNKRCVSMNSNFTGNVSARLDFGGDVDGNDDMWIGFECP